MSAYTLHASKYILGLCCRKNNQYKNMTLDTWMLYDMVISTKIFSRFLKEVPCILLHLWNLCMAQFWKQDHLASRRNEVLDYYRIFRNLSFNFGHACINFCLHCEMTQCLNSLLKNCFSTTFIPVKIFGENDIQGV